jgi:TolB-like protein/DNA-binding winged helix-turn-helix (wHTH) protein/cytochrome c-type biogenesis protein CcmH/NrfG
MTTRDADPPTPMRAERLRFDRYVLDLDRGCLLLDGNEIALRPKTFAVLHYLIENVGRLVSKDELFAAVWPNLVITDDALVQSIGELRRALEDDGSRLIRTIPRRGYRFESEVSVVPSVGQSSADATSVSAASGDGVPSPEPVVGTRTPLTFFTMAPTGWRIGLFVSFTLAVLLAAGVLWSGVGSEWKFPNVLGYGDRSATKSPVIGAKPAIAVLPLVNQSDDSNREYFADGLTQDIINALGRFSALTVISWNGVFPYKGKPASPEQIGRDLAVTYLVEGSVRQIGDRVRVSAQLVDTRQGRVLWSARFDEALADVFALQDNITTQVVSALAIRVAQIEQRRVFAKPTENLEAYDYVLRARPAFQRPTRANNAEARVLLRRAIELDPNYAAAYTALAETYYTATSMGWAESPTANLSRAEELAIKALSLEHSEVRARVNLARVHILHQRYKQAEAEIERAIAINANDAQSLAGRGNILMWLGQTDAAIKALEQAQRIDPDLNAIDRFALGLAYYLKRRYDAAIEQAELNLRETAGANSSRIVLAAAYAQQNRTEDAARIVTEIRRIDPTFDPQEFGTKFLNAVDLERLRDGLRKAGLLPAEAGVSRPHRTNDR